MPVDPTNRNATRRLPGTRGRRCSVPLGPWWSAPKRWRGLACRRGASASRSGAASGSGFSPGVADSDGGCVSANLAGRVAASASSLYARNLFSFIETLVDKSAKALAVKWDDELVKATALTRDGAVIHPNFQPKA